jgi:hypothetical protein
MFGAFGELAAPRMFGQWWVALEGAACRLCAVVLEWVVAVVDVLEEAALAIAAPPPTRAPVSRSVVAKDFNFRIGTHLLSRLGQVATIPVRRRRGVGGS